MERETLLSSTPKMRNSQELMVSQGGRVSFFKGVATGRSAMLQCIAPHLDYVGRINWNLCAIKKKTLSGKDNGFERG